MKTVPIEEYEALAQRHQAVCNDLATRLVTQQRLTEIATENLADALIARDEAVRIADLAGTRYIEAVAKAETNHRREVAAHKAGVEAERKANALLAETYDYIGTKRLGSMAPRIRVHLNSLVTP
jgi:hypothetical protein